MFRNFFEAFTAGMSNKMKRSTATLACLIVVPMLYAVPAIGLGAAPSQNKSRKVDFKNFEYPWRLSGEWPDNLKWLNMRESHRVSLVDGKWFAHDDERLNRTDAPFEGLTLESVQFGNVTGDRRPEALVCLRFDTGGTQYSYYVYVFSLQARRPVLLAYFHAGDRSYSGLYRVYAEGGKLVVELFDPEKRHGDCCSGRFIRTRYRWQNGVFVRFGYREFGTPKSTTRLPTSVFGIHK